jgi:hypothetical protein
MASAVSNHIFLSVKIKSLRKMFATADVGYRANAANENSQATHAHTGKNRRTS